MNAGFDRLDCDPPHAAVEIAVQLTGCDELKDFRLAPAAQAPGFSRADDQRPHVDAGLGRLFSRAALVMFVHPNPRVVASVRYRPLWRERKFLHSAKREIDAELFLQNCFRSALQGNVSRLRLVAIFVV